MHNKGDIVLIPFPFTDLSGQKVRPAVILSCPKGGDDCIVAFITSVKPQSRFIIHIPFPTQKETGLKAESWLRIDKIATLTHKSIIGKLGNLPSTLLKETDACIRKILEL